MAALTSGREAALHVVGIRGSLVILEMAIHARAAGQLVVIVHMTLRTLEGGVSASKREAGGSVVENGIVPGNRAVTGLAGLWEPCLRVIGVRGSLVVLQVAGDTLGAGQVVVVVNVTLRALQRRVGPGKRKTNQGMVEIRRLPGRRGVTSLASPREVSGDVVRICRALKIFQMTAHAVCWGALELPADVAGIAIQRRVRAGQSKPGELQMIECRPKPAVEGVALLAGGWEPGGNMIWPGGALVVLCVT